jgi:hypothetical protein
MHLLPVRACSLDDSSPLKREPHFMTHQEEFASGRKDPPLQGTNTVYILYITLCERPPRVKKFPAEGDGPFSREVDGRKRETISVRLKRCSPSVNQNISCRILPFGPAGGGIGSMAAGGRDATPRWTGALRSRRWGGALGGNLRRIVNRTEGKTNTDPVGGALPPAFATPSDGQRREEGPEGPFFPGSLPTASHRLQAVQALKRSGR